jgi:hypothetical protein
MQILSEPNANFFDISSEPNIYELFSSELRNLQNSNDILLCGGGREWGGPRRRWRQVRRRSECMVWTRQRSRKQSSAVLRRTQRRSRRVAWTRRWLGRRSAWHQGSHGGGAGARRGPVGGRGGVGADSAVVGEAPTWRWARRRNIPVGDGGNDSSQG